MPFIKKCVFIVVMLRAPMYSKRYSVIIIVKYLWQFPNRISQSQWLMCKSFDLMLSKRPSKSLLDSFLYEVCIYTMIPVYKHINKAKVSFMPFIKKSVIIVLGHEGTNILKSYSDITIQLFTFLWGLYLHKFHLSVFLILVYEQKRIS